jgi:hypothetical protein
VTREASWLNIYTGSFEKDTFFVKKDVESRTLLIFAHVVFERKSRRQRARLEEGRFILILRKNYMMLSRSR